MANVSTCEVQAPLVSIIMPAYNAAKFIEESIYSALSQSYSNFELIIVNDGSTDDTSAKVRAIEDYRIKLIEQSNAGVSTARNAGIKIARGEFIAFLDSDDLWMDIKLEKQVKVFLSYDDVGLVFSETYCFSDKLSNSYYLPYREPTGIADVYQRLLTHDFIPTLTVMLRKKVLDIVSPSGFDCDLFGTEDWDLWIKLAKNSTVYHIEEVLAYYRIHGAGISKNFDRHHNEELKVLRKHVLGNDSVSTDICKLAFFIWEKKHLIHLLKSKMYFGFLSKSISIFWRFGIVFSIRQMVAMLEFRRNMYSTV